MMGGNCITFQGQSHKKAIPPTVCQDCSGILRNKTYVIAAVADGHGSREYVRSEIGSQIAVEVALDIVEKHLACSDFVAKLKADGDKQLRHMEKEIIDEWTKRINDYQFKHAYDEKTKEIKNITSSPLKDPSAYGTTLLIIANGKNYAFSMQIGDGLVTAFFGKNGFEKRSLELHPLCQGRFTTSLCDKNALSEFCHIFWIGPDMPKALFISTDGFTNALNEKDQIQFANIILALSGNRNYWYSSVSDTIGKLINRGNKDDISIAVVYSDNAVINTAFKNHTQSSEKPLYESYGPTYIIHYGGEYQNTRVFELTNWIAPNGLIFKGETVNGSPCGKSSFIKDNVEYEYEGTYENYLPSGEGKISSNGKLIYEGQFYNGTYNGFGKLYLGNTMIYEGSFKSGLYHGQGIAYSNSKVLYRGEFEKGLWYGEGELYINDSPTPKKGHFEEKFFLEPQIKYILELLKKESTEDPKRLFNLSIISHQPSSIQHIYAQILEKIGSTPMEEMSESKLSTIIKSTYDAITNTTKQNPGGIRPEGIEDRYALVYYLCKYLCIYSGCQLRYVRPQ